MTRLIVLSCLTAVCWGGGLSSLHTIDIKSRSNISVNEIQGEGGIHIFEDSWIKSKLSSSSDIILGDRTKIVGSVRAKNSVIQGNGVIVEGGVVQNASVSVPKIQPVHVVPGETSYSVEPHGTLSLQPGSFGTLMAHANGVIEMEAGEYFFDQFELEPECQLVLSGPVVLSVRSHLKISDRTKINESKNNAFPLTIKSQQQGPLFIGTDAVVVASIVAPYADIRVGSRTLLVGELSSQSIAFEPEVRMCNAPQAISLRSSYSGFEQYMGGGLYRVELPLDAKEFDINPAFSDSSVKIQYRMGGSRNLLDSNTTLIKFHITDPSRGGISERCTDADYTVEVTKKWPVFGDDQKMTPALQYFLSHSGEEDLLPVVVRIHASPTFNRINRETNRLKGIIHPYTKADIDAFMAEEKQKFEIVEREYQEMWSQVGVRHGLSFAALKASDLSYPSNQFQLSPAMIHALAQDSLVVLLDAQGEEPQPLLAELVHQIHLAPYTPTVTTSPIPPDLQIPSNELLWNTQFGKTMKGAGIKAATGETGLWSSVVSALNLNESNVFINDNNINKPEDHHSQLTFLSLYRAAPEAEHFHLKGTNFRAIQDTVKMKEPNVLSISYVNRPGRGGRIANYSEYLAQVNSQFAPPYPLIVGAADNQGENSSGDNVWHSSLVSWASWATLVVGNSGFGGVMPPLKNGTRCSSSENWPAQFGAPFGDVELPHVVAPGGTVGNTGILFGVDPYSPPDYKIMDPITAPHYDVCGTSISAPLVVGTIASLMTHMPSFIGFPEIGKVVVILTAVNAHGPDSYTTYNPAKIVTHNGVDYMGMDDGVDGTGEVNAMQAGVFMKNLGYATSVDTDDKRMWPQDHPSYHDANGNRSQPVERGLSWFYFRAGLKDASGNAVKYGTNGEEAIFNASSGDFEYPILVPNKSAIEGKHLRCVFTWQARTNENGTEIVVDDFDMQLNDANGNPVTPDNIGNSFENNVEVIDWEPGPNDYGKVIYLSLQGSLRGTANVPVGTKDLRAVVGWEWVKSQTR